MVEHLGPDKAEKLLSYHLVLSLSMLLLLVGIGHPPDQDDVYIVLHNYKNTKILLFCWTYTDISWFILFNYYNNQENLPLLRKPFFTFFSLCLATHQSHPHQAFTIYYLGISLRCK